MTTTLEPLFDLPGLPIHRRRRTERITSVLGTPLPATPHGYALAHHFLEGAEQAARAQEADLLAWYRTTPPDLLAHLSDGTHTILNPHPEQRARAPISETEYYLVAPDTPAPSIHTRALIHAAIASATDHGFGPLLRNHAPIICLLDHRQVHDPLHSWALTRLPGTVFTDYTDHPEVLARDLIHEAAHNWLNEALALHAVQLPDDITFYSPWRGTHRPLFGFLHACWAFALTVLYSQRAISEVLADQTVASFLNAYQDMQRNLLKSAAKQLPAALRILPPGALKDRLYGTFSQAREVLAEPSRG
ncbi:aKG-HExxH-type peptide beta-hydroxylase [Streptomyces sp. NPDC002851]